MRIRPLKRCETGLSGSFPVTVMLAVILHRFGRNARGR